MAEFDILRASAAGMDAERSALDLAARNVAAAQATPDRGSFERLLPRFALAPAPQEADELEPPSNLGDEDAGDDGDDDASSSLPVRYVGATPERGVDVDAVTEMVAVLDAQRAYEANASVLVLIRQTLCGLQPKGCEPGDQYSGIPRSSATSRASLKIVQTSEQKRSKWCVGVNGLQHHSHVFAFFISDAVPKPIGSGRPFGRGLRSDFWRIDGEVCALHRTLPWSTSFWTSPATTKDGSEA